MMTEQELQEITHSILIRYGIDFGGYEASSLIRGIERLMRKHRMENSFALWKRILTDDSFIHTFIDEITVGHTEMFRNPELWKKVISELLPTVSEHAQICTWHAGCASGEEVFTMAVVMEEAGLYEKSLITGTDLNKIFIEQAQSGEVERCFIGQDRSNYQVYSGDQQSHLDSFLLEKEQRYFLKNDLQRNLRFLQQSLTEEAPFGQFELIFCRNVLIYFNKDLRSKIYQRFYRKLRWEGFLILGAFESLPKGLDAFECIDPVNKIYQKKKTATF